MPKTALMGSPLAVIGTVFRHRRTLAKTGAAVGGVLMLPIPVSYTHLTLQPNREV